MVAIQALEQRTAQVAGLERLVEEQQAQLQRMEERLRVLEARWLNTVPGGPKS